MSGHPPATCYLFQFDVPYRHARHYLAPPPISSSA